MVLHFIADQDDPAGTIRHLLGGIRSTSYLVVGHAASDTDPGAGRTPRVGTARDRPRGYGSARTRRAGAFSGPVPSCQRPGS